MASECASSAAGPASVIAPVSMTYPYDAASSASATFCSTSRMVARWR
ncbi:Uncharacterised protein [Bordetella pertussis]|nr:Uncharacterised protein [Bordetella pertussis]